MGIYLSRMPPQRIRAANIRRVRFRRAALGRRGLAEEQVYAFVRWMVDELTAREATETALRDQNARLRRALRERQDWQAARRHRNAGRWKNPHY
ncbi:DivIVA domain-containing protein [Micromonospora sp. NPDC049559]|uniref:DivIVA domain-containing protein n=1 Tax=Micromonospora sp. NPDC049559 TaxID=3155923 RepID=UPI0034261B56